MWNAPTKRHGVAEHPSSEPMITKRSWNSFKSQPLSVWTKSSIGMMVANWLLLVQVQNELHSSFSGPPGYQWETLPIHATFDRSSAGTEHWLHMAEERSARIMTKYIMRDVQHDTGWNWREIRVHGSQYSSLGPPYGGYRKSPWLTKLRIPDLENRFVLLFAALPYESLIGRCHI